MGIVEQIGSAPDGHRRLRIANPATLEPVGEIQVDGAAEVRAAVDRARKAQPAWEELGFEGRAHYLLRAVRVLLEKQDELLDVIVSETGKPRVEALGSEIVASCDALTFYAKRAKRILADEHLPLHLVKSKRLRVHYRPLGVVGIITPWNFPLVLSLNPTAQALMAGNAVVLKPSESTPFSGQLVETLFREVDLPEGVFNLLLGDGETGAALVEADVDKISFTGSVRTGRRVAAACGRRLLPCTLELGGKDPMIVCADADLRRAARGAVWGAFANAGQICTSTERVYVVEEVAEDFTRQVLEETATLRQGHEGEFEVGAVIWPAQLETIESHVKDATAKGARVLAGGRRNPELPGYFYEPTVLADVDHGMQVMREESFGPLLPIMRVPDEATALRMANDSRYGLNASVWTRDSRRGTQIAQAIESGCAVVNDCMLTYGVTEAPFGGIKDSGIGRVNGERGLKGFCREQSILISRFGGKSEPLWYPYTAGKLKWMRRTLRFVWGSSLGRLLS